MVTLLTYVFALLLVGGLLFLVASFVFGRGEEMAPALPEGTPVELPDDRPAAGADLRALRLSVVLRGYRMDEVDWVLDRIAEQVDARDREITRLRSALRVEPITPAHGSADAVGPDGGSRPAGRVLARARGETGSAADDGPDTASGAGDVTDEHSPPSSGSSADDVVEPGEAGPRSATAADEAGPGRAGSG